MDRPLPQNRFLRGIYLMIQRYLRHNVGIQSAALAFYLLFTLFPLMIFISALLGLLDLNVAGILEALREILPLEILEFIGVYLTYVGENPSPQLLLFGLFFSLYFPMRATNALMRSVRTAYHLGPPRRGGGPPAQKPFVYGAPDRGHRRDTGVDDGGQPVFGVRCGKLPPAAVCGRDVGPAPVPGGGHGGFLCPLFPLCAGPG